MYNKFMYLVTNEKMDESNYLSIYKVQQGFNIAHLCADTCEVVLFTDEKSARDFYFSSCEKFYSQMLLCSDCQNQAVKYVLHNKADLNRYNTDLLHIECVKML